MNDARKPDVYRFIINPRAGRRSRADLTGVIESVFSQSDRPIDCQILLTEQPGHATALAQSYAKTYGDRVLVVACGGDGTAREVASGLLGSQAAMTVLPIGTGNDFVKTVFSTQDINQLIPRLPQPDIRLIDTMDINGSVCVNITSLGFDTKVQRTAQRLNARFRQLGGMVYTLAIFPSLFGQRSYPIHYELQVRQEDGSETMVSGSNDMILTAICNGQYYGGGFRPAPLAKVDDGLLTFSMIDALPLRKIFPLIPRYKKGTHLALPAVHAWETTSGTIWTTEGVLLGNKDGDSFEDKRVSYRVVPKSLYFAFY